jgi:hypothetical protein
MVGLSKPLIVVVALCFAFESSYHLVLSNREGQIPKSKMADIAAGHFSKFYLNDYCTL